MRRLTLLLAGATVWLFLAAVPVFADGGPHSKDANNGSLGIKADTCAGCHRAHTAQADFLLVVDETALCLACHQAGAPGSTTDVENGVQYRLAAALGTPRADLTEPAIAGALRDGGFKTARIGDPAVRYTYGWVTHGGPPVPGLVGLVPPSTTGATVTSAHVIGTSGIVWGNGALGSNDLGPTINQLECTTCHNVHGNGNYRILNNVPKADDGAFVATTGTGVAVTDFPPYAQIPDGDTRNYTIHQTPITGPTASDGLYFLGQVNANAAITSSTGDYWRGNVPWNNPAGNADAPNGKTNNFAPTGFKQQITAWCSTCHTRITAPAGAHNVPSGDTIFNHRHATQAGYDPACTTCHVAHGTNVKMDSYVTSQRLVPGTSGAAIAAGNMTSSFLLKIDNRGTCQMCHEPTWTSATGTIIPPGANPIVP